MAKNYPLNISDMAYIPHPGETLSEKLDEMNMSIKEFAVRTNKPEKTIHAVISGKSSITDDMAIAFETVTEIPARFWLNLQHTYDEYLARERKKEKQASEFEWAKKFPYAEMAKNKWIPEAQKMEDKYNNLLSFFRLSSSEAWQNFYLKSSLKVEFRISLANTKDPYSVSAWMRQAEIMANEIELYNPYSAISLSQKVSDIKMLLKEMPADWSKQLKDIFAYCGVKLVYIHTLPKAPISGCTRWINNAPCIFLTDRHTQYDSLCFSLLHEVCHILKHGKKSIFLEDVTKTHENDEKENEANSFASETLWPTAQMEEFINAGNFSESDIYKASNTYNVHPSVIVGRLQYMQKLPDSNLSSLIKHVNLFS